MSTYTPVLTAYVGDYFPFKCEILNTMISLLTGLNRHRESSLTVGMQNIIQIMCMFIGSIFSIFVQISRTIWKL